MGRAIMAGILEQKLFQASQVVVSDTSKEQVAQITQKYGVSYGSNKEAAQQDITILAVKPQMMEEVLEEIKSVTRADQIIVSIAIGHSISFYKGILGSAIKFVRVIPNTPVSVGEGLSALCYQGPTLPEDVEIVRSIFDVIGKTIILDESLINTVSALSGSGPAIVDIFIEALADGVVRFGLPRKVAYEVAAQTLLGSAKLALDSKLHPGELKDQVCSPGGTTIEAVAALEKNGFRYAVIDAIAECVKKAERM